RFMSEFNEDGALSHATPEHIERAFMEKTNDFNEAAFGMYRQTARVNPTISPAQYNSRQMYKFNNTSNFLHSLSPKMHAWLRRITRKQDDSGAGRQEKLRLAEYRQNVAETRMKKDEANAARRQAAEEEINAVTPILNITELESRLQKGSSKYLTVTNLTLQLKWHRMHSPLNSIPNLGSKRDEKISFLRVAINRHIDSRASSILSTSASAVDDVEEDHPDMIWRITWTIATILVEI
ncbi:hypothetical protein F5890DRAFT_1413898, partial [Lentinula detonsa]